MKNLDLKNIKFYKDLSKKEFILFDASKELANFIYTNMTGIAYHALALKIWDSDGKVELDEEEEQLLWDVVNRYLKPCVIDAIKEQLQQEV